LRLPAPRPGIVKALSLALALVGLGAQAQDNTADHPPFPTMPTLVFPSSTRAGAGSDDATQFHLTASRDLKESGAFHLLNPAKGSGGADLMLRFVTHSLARGKLLIEGECINLATGAVVLKKSFMGQTAGVDRMAHRLVDFLVGKVTGTPGVADSSIVFARPTTPGVQEIFAADGDGRNLRQLTSFGSLTSHPAMAGDGRLAVVTYKGGPPQIWGQVRPKSPFALIYPKDSPAGMELSDLAWSPDGRKLSFVQESRKGLTDIQLLDLASGQVARLTEPGHTSRRPCWSPDGTSIAFLSDRDGTPQVFIMASDGSHLRRLTSDPAPKACLAWNAKGDRLAYTAASGGSTGLFTVAPAGTGAQQTATIPGPVASLCWAPDGRSLLLGQGSGASARLRIAGLDGKVREVAGSLNGRFGQWVQNPAPMVVRDSPDRGTPYPVPALIATTPRLQ
jgi:TolB protein